MSFDWQTEEDGWSHAMAEDDRRSSRCRRILLLAPFLLALLAAAWLIRGRVEEQVASVSSAMTTDVETSARIARQAIRLSDVELLVSVLSGEDAAWAEQMQHQLLAGELLRRDALGLSWRPGWSHILTVTLSADLLQADVLIAEAYDIAVGGGVTDTVWLQHAEVYRRGRERWLLAPAGRASSEPAPAEELTFDGNALRVTYPAYEEALAGRLAADLDRKLTEACNAVDGLRCPGRLELRMRSDAALPGALQELASEGAALPERLILPAPSVLGRPRNEAAYDALYRGYASILVSRLLYSAADRDCCEPRALTEALVHQQLVEFGLAASRATPATYRDLLDYPWSLLRRGWNGVELNVEAGPAQLDVLVAFLRDGAGAPSIPELLAALAASPGLDSWIRRNVTPHGSFWTDWSRHLTQRTGSGRSVPADLGSTLVSACPAFDNLGLPQGTLWQLDSGTDNWNEVQITRGLPGPDLVSFPRSRGALLLNTTAAGDATELLVWFPGAPPMAVALDPAMPAPAQLFLNRQDSDWLFFSVFDAGMQPAGMARLDATACSVERCTLDYFPDDLFTVWSPDRDHSLVSEAPWSLRRHSLPWPLALADGDRQRFESLGAGSHPFWLDDERFGWVRPSLTDENVGPELVLASIEDPSPTPWIEAATLRDALGSAAAQDNLMVTGLWASPGGSGFLFLSLDQESGPPAWVMIDAQDRPRLMATRAQALGGVTFAPDGRSAALEVGQDDDWHSILVNLETGSQHLFAGVDPTASPRAAWTPDSDWLAVGQGPYTTLISRTGARHVVTSPNPFCGQVAWVAAGDGTAQGESP